MSYRELKEFAELTQTLGFPERIGVNSFRKPNFALVAKLLQWIAERLAPDHSTGGAEPRIRTLTERVRFLNGVLDAIGMPLDATQLYHADGRAVRQLLVPLRVLYQAHLQNCAQPLSGEELQEADSGTLGEALQEQVEKLRQSASANAARSLLRLGEELDSLLLAERSQLPQRRAAARFAESLGGLDHDAKRAHDEVTKALQRQQETWLQERTQTEQQLEAAKSKESALRARVQRKEEELARAHRRLQSLKTVKPAFAAEHEQLEAQLVKLYAEYIERVRNTRYLDDVRETALRKRQQRDAKVRAALLEVREALKSEELRDMDMDRNDQGDEDSDLLPPEEFDATDQAYTDTTRTAGTESSERPLRPRALRRQDSAVTHSSSEHAPDADAEVMMRIATPSARLESPQHGEVEHSLPNEAISSGRATGGEPKPMTPSTSSDDDESFDSEDASF